MGIKIWNMEPQQVNLLVSISDSTIICTSSTFDMSKQYIINNSGILSFSSYDRNYIKNSTPITIIFTFWNNSSDDSPSNYEVSPGETMQFAGDYNQVKCSAKTKSNTIVVGVTAT